MNDDDNCCREENNHTQVVEFVIFTNLYDGDIWLNYFSFE